MAHKKGGGSSRNGRDSNPQMLGVKIYGRQLVKGGQIIVRQWHAEAGTPGAGRRRTGRNAPDLVLDVPVGTLALGPDGSLIADLDRPGATAVVARGGEGGRGNVHFKSSTRQAPDFAEPGLKGDEREIALDLKLIADVGQIGRAHV